VTDFLQNHYSSYDENNRLLSKRGQIEFLTTMRYIERYLTPGARILEVGAGTGRYSLALADMGYSVEAVELVQYNIDIFTQNIKTRQDVRVTQGNAMDLSAFDSDAFDITLLLGPLYHLYTVEDKRQAISEALRVTKPGGIVFAAYCLSDASLIQEGFQRGLFSMFDYIKRGKIDPASFHTTSTPEDIFELVRKEDIDALMTSLPVERLHYIATDLFMNYMRSEIDAMDDELFALYLRYHFILCEREDMVGISNHSLDVFRKK